MAPAPLPLELVTDIIEATVELLIEEEGQLEAHAPLSNRFLLSAALVDRTWNSIAGKGLLKRGMVTSRSVVGFLAQVKAHGMEATLESVRFGEATGGVKEEDAANEDTAFDLLVESLSGLTNIELVDSGSHFKTALPSGRVIHNLHLSNHDLMRGGFSRKFPHCTPAHLVVTETRKSPNLLPESLADAVSMLLGAARVLKDVQRFTITTSDTSGASCFGWLAIIGGTHSRLRTCHFEVTSSASYRQVLTCMQQVVTPTAATVFSYPHLEHISSHLIPASFLLVLGTHPRLTSLEILPDPPGLHKFDTELTVFAPVLLLLLKHLPVLATLKTPACWASDEVREWCEAKGVTLLSE